MIYKKWIGLVFCVTTFIILFMIPSYAASNGSVKNTSFVEFKVLAPDDFFDTVEISLTEKSSGLVYHYYLYSVNDYVLIERVPYGKYKVSCAVSENNEKYGFIYNEACTVESSSNAISLRVIIDNLECIGAADGTSSNTDFSGDNYIAGVSEIASEKGGIESTTHKSVLNNNKIETAFGEYQPKINYKSLLITFIVLSVGAGVFLYMRNRKD